VITQRVGRWREMLREQQRRLRLRDPRRALAEQRQRLDELARRAALAMGRMVAAKRAGLAQNRASLRALHPQWVLTRGYAIIRDRVTGRHLRHIAQIARGQKISIDLCDGRAEAEVLDSISRPDPDQETGSTIEG